MPYSVGEKGSYGCSGYPVLKDDDKTVMGCHNTPQEAGAQIAAIEASENKTYAEKDTVTSGGGVGIKNPQAWPGTKIKDPKLKKDLPEDDMNKACWDGYTQRGVKPGKGGRMVPNCVPISKSQERITEGDFVSARTTEGVVVGQVEHVMTEGGTYGQPGNPYSVRSTPENPAVAIRLLEEDDGLYYYTPYSVGALMSDVERINMPNISLDEYEEDEKMSKADTYSPNDGMKSAARRALKWKSEGKATGAGTPVGWGRATDIVAGRSMSLSTVKRMFSFFSRHEQASKGGKDFNNTSNPSNGRIMWDAWGGDAGFTWSRAIVNRMKDKALFSDFGKDWTKSTGMTDLFKAKGVSVGDHVIFGVPKPPDGTMRAHGKVERVARSGKVTLPGSNESAEATSENPVAIVRVWATKEDGMYQETDRRVVKPFSALTVSDAPLEKIIDEDFDKAASGKEARFRELVEEYNKGKEGNKRLTVGLLRQVYNRGIGAYRTNSSSVRPNVSSAEQWAMARVNAYMKGLRGNFPRSAFDLDLFPAGHPRHSKGDKK